MPVRCNVRKYFSPHHRSPQPRHHLAAPTTPRPCRCPRLARATLTSYTIIRATQTRRHP